MRRMALWFVIAAWTTAGGAEAADREGPRALVERFARLLEERDAGGLADLYHGSAGHRDLASGQRVRGARALRHLYARRLAASDAGQGRVRIDSYRLLSTEVAIAQLTLSGSSPQAAPGAERTWPPYTALLVSREDGRWGVAATRAGGNPEPVTSSPPDP